MINQLPPSLSAVTDDQRTLGELATPKSPMISQGPGGNIKDFTSTPDASAPPVAAVTDDEGPDRETK